MRREEDHVEAVLEAVRVALRDLRFGTITVVVHDGEVAQIERTEKVRVLAPAQSRSQ